MSSAQISFDKIVQNNKSVFFLTENEKNYCSDLYYYQKRKF